jgi:hypothetical protein
MLDVLNEYVADVPTAIGYGTLLLGLLIVLLAAVWPLDHSAKPDPMADAFGDWPHIDPRV